MSIITGNFRIEIEASEKEVFKAFKQFMKENFQNYNFSVAGKTETLKDSFYLKDFEEERKKREEKAKENEIKEAKQGILS